MEYEQDKRKRLPHWVKMEMPSGRKYTQVKNLVNRYGLHTICASGHCPNIGECWNRGTATFMILGDICTRNCKFCSVKTGRPLPPDPEEPARVAESVTIMGLTHGVITSVDRDDLPDLGSIQWAQTIQTVKAVNSGTTLEVLIPDFQGREECIQRIMDQNPEVISHNLETVERLTPAIRSAANYRRSLSVLKYISGSGITTKSGIMLGLGEKRDEILKTMDDLREVGCEVMTLGQYLAPTKNHLPVAEYIHPGVFEEYKQIGLQKGFAFVESHPLVRSSYHAENHVNAKKVEHLKSKRDGCI